MHFGLQGLLLSCIIPPFVNTAQYLNEDHVALGMRIRYLLTLKGLEKVRRGSNSGESKLRNEKCAVKLETLEVKSISFIIVMEQVDFVLGSTLLYLR